MYLLRKFDDADDTVMSVAVSECVSSLQKAAEEHAEKVVHWQAYITTGGIEFWHGSLRVGDPGTYAIGPIKFIKAKA